MSLETNPRIISVSSACGCTLTATSVRGLTPDDMEALAAKEVDLATVILKAKEAKMLGVQERGLAALLRSNIKNIKPALSTTKVDEQSIILPYIQRTQRSYWNSNYWSVVAGTANANAGVGTMPASAWDVTVRTTSQFSDFTVKEKLERYFLPGNTFILLTWDATTTKVARVLEFKILASENADSGGVAQATVTLEPNVSSTAWDGMTSEEKAVYQPVFGVAQTGVNAISDRESWCYNPPTELSKRIIVNWLQTSRTSRCVDEEYLRILNLIQKGKVNPYQLGFKWNSIGEQNKQQAQLEERDFMNSVFFGQRINELQTPSTYDQLPTVYDIDAPDCPLEYKAKALGLYTMLVDAGRVIDLNGGTLSLDTIFSKLYELMLYRQADGTEVTVIDSMTDRWTAARIYDGMCAYYKDRYGIDTIRYAKVGEKITHDGQVLFNYNLYDIPEVGIQWAVFHDPFFDAHVSAFNHDVDGVSFASRGRMLWFLDWSEIGLGIAGTKTVQRKSPDPDTNALYKCVIQANVKTYTLRSQRWTVFCDRPHRHLMFVNFNDTKPTNSYSGS